MKTNTKQQTSDVEQDETTDIELPVKGIDQDETLDERLTDNVVDRIGPARYFERDSDGDSIETWDDVFARVASNIADAERQFGAEEHERSRWKRRFESAMRELRFVPNSPTLMNAGLPLQQLSACIAGDAPVYTRSGLKAMADVEVGDEVLTHEGRFKPVTAHWSNGMKQTVGLHRGTSRVSSYDVRATPDHKFLSGDGDWVRADEIENAVAPEFPDVGHFPETIRVSEYTAQLSERNQQKAIAVNDGRVVVENDPDEHRTGTYDEQLNRPVDVVQNDDDLAWAFGLYLAEGDVTGTDLRFTLSSDETDIAERLIDVFETSFDVPVSISESSHGNWTQYRVSSPFICDLFSTQCGTGVHKKRLPSWIGAAPRSYQESLLDGLIDGDGHRGSSGDKLVLANPTLVYESTLLARSVGYDANFRHDKTRELSSHQTSKMYRSTADRSALGNIARDDTGTVEVFDMEVEDDHSFVVGDFIVHNCFVLEPRDDMAHINKTQSDAGAIFKSGGGVGYAFHHLRPKGSRVSSTGGVSSGPLSFMELYDTTCQTIKQGGKRRGAQMAIMHSHHPDVGRFCVSKRGEDRFSNFNISVGLTDDFIDAVRNDEDYTLYDPTSRPSDDHDLRDGDPFEVVPETAHFYDPEFEDAWNDEYGKPGIGLDGKQVETNFWRDYQDDIAVGMDEFRDRIDLDVGEPLTLPARFIWNLLIDGAHNNGEPGIFHLDEVNREHSFDGDENPEHIIHATNPCVTGDTLVYTSSGLVRAEELYESGTATDVVVDERLDAETIKEASSVYKTGTKDVYTLTTNEGYEIRLTADHRVMTDDGWVEASDLSSGDTVHVLSNPGAFGDHGSYEMGAVLGWLVGDGHLKHGEERAVLNFYDEDEHLSERFAGYVNEIVRDPIGNGDYTVGVSDVTRNGLVEQRVRSMRLYEIAMDVGMVESKHIVPDPIRTGSKEQVRGFISALFSADGHVEGDSESGLSARLSSIDRSMLQDVQRLLLQFGIQSTIYDMNDGGPTELPDGSGGTDVYDTQDTHRLAISADSLSRFADEIGFEHERKQERLESELDAYSRGPYSKPFTATVDSIEYDGCEDVYDLTEPDTSSFIANGFVVHNCSEQPLEEHEACNLGHVNLSLMLSDSAPSFTDFEDRFEHESGPELVPTYLNRVLDMDRFEETITTGVRFLDNVVTQSEFPLDEITGQVRSKRKIGLGLMGFHQMLIQMGVEYGSDVSYEVAREIMRRIDAKATEVSHELAKTRGCFDSWGESKWATPTEHRDWIRTHGHTDPDQYPSGYPMRNHNVTTIAPTGTTSMIGNTTGGCEPIYQVAYFKNVGDDIQGDEMLVEFDDYFLRVLDRNDVDVESVKEEATALMKDNAFDGVDSLDTVPDELGELFVTTQDLDPEQHIRMQAAFQEFCDSGISKTLNMPHDASVDDVSEAFLLATDLGIKGTTVYRDGSRDEQVKTTRLDNSLDDGELDDESLVQMLVDQRNLSVKAEHTLRKELGVKPDPENSERECDECGSGQLDLSEGCPICLSCGFSPCS